MRIQENPRIKSSSNDWHIIEYGGGGGGETVKFNYRHLKYF